MGRAVQKSEVKHTFQTQQPVRKLLTGCHADARRELFASLDRAEEILGKQRYIAGNLLTEVQLFSPCMPSFAGSIMMLKTCAH